MATELVDKNGNHLLVNADGSVSMAALKSATSTCISIASTSTAATVLAANTNRLGATVSNNSTSVLFVTLGLSTTSSSTAFTATLAPLSTGVAAYYEVPFRWTGAISAQHGTASNGSITVTELTS